MRKALLKELKKNYENKGWNKWIGQNRKNGYSFYCRKQHKKYRNKTY